MVFAKFLTPEVFSEINTMTTTAFPLHFSGVPLLIYSVSGESSATASFFFFKFYF